MPIAQVPCGYDVAGEPCAARVCLEKMAAHYMGAHEAEMAGGAHSWPCPAKILDDGSKVVLERLLYTFPNNGAGWFVYSALNPAIFRTVIGGLYALDLQRFNASELRFGVRQLSLDPPRHRLASMKVSFGAADGICFQYPLSRALAADERLEDDALCASTPPVVMCVDPAFLAPALVLRPGTPPPEDAWGLTITLSLVFQLV